MEDTAFYTVGKYEAIKYMHDRSYVLLICLTKHSKNHCPTELSTNLSWPNKRDMN